MRLALRSLLAIALVSLLGACVNQTVKSTSVPAIKNASVEVPEGQLLDVGIAVFDPGIDDYDEEEDQRIYPEVRRAEARYMPGILSEAMQDSGARGMQTFDDALYGLYQEGRISLDEALSNADSRTNLEAKINFG